MWIQQRKPVDFKDAIYGEIQTELEISSIYKHLDR